MRRDVNKEAFNDYQLSTSLGLIRGIACVTGLFNAFLIIPDVMNLSDPGAVLLMIIYRSVFFVSAALLVLFIKKIKTFDVLALLVTVYELAAAYIFFHVLSMYREPDFVIQLLGAFIIIIVVFFVPNKWMNMVALSAAIAAGFLIYSYLKPGISKDGGLDASHFIAAAVYLGIEIIMCSISSFFFIRYKRGEFHARAELQKIYATDPLTKIGNRVKLENEANKWFEYCSRHNVELSLVLIDVDDLKQVNDEYGHLTGDTILYELAQIMHTQLRINDVCVRWGGDEFILLLPHTGTDDAQILTHRIRAAIQGHHFNNHAVVTCSFGIADLKYGLNLDQLIHKADDSMYVAKKQGKDNVAVSTEDI